jgi:3'-phosphoadenosine 5'-phosphosulfate sulfotransferase (PAPS reductase)/FAD synthetase
MHVVGLSGGKDSTAMALRLVEVEPREYTYVITPTGDELPPMVEHWKRLETLLGKPLIRVTQAGRTPGRDTWPSSLDMLAQEFASGRKIRGEDRSRPCRVCTM